MINNFILRNEIENILDCSPTSIQSTDQTEKPNYSSINKSFQKPQKGDTSGCDKYGEDEVGKLTKSIDEKPIGGLGILLVKHLMTDVKYERTNGKNRVTLIKELTQGE